MKARLCYKQITRLNQWYFFFAEWYSEKQLTRAFRTIKEAEKYAISNNIDYKEDEMKSIFV